ARLAVDVHDEVLAHPQALAHAGGERVLECAEDDLLGDVLLAVPHAPHPHQFVEVHVRAWRVGGAGRSAAGTRGLWRSIYARKRVPPLPPPGSWLQALDLAAEI